MVEAEVGEASEPESASTEASSSSSSIPSTTPSPRPKTDIVGRWARLDDIETWMEEMVEIHGMRKDGTIRAELFFAGRSEEGRMLKGIKIGSGHEVRPQIGSGQEVRRQI